MLCCVAPCCTRCCNTHGIGCGGRFALCGERLGLQPPKPIDYNVPLTVRQAQEVVANSKRLMAQAVSWVGRNTPGTMQLGR
jgi:hypothetical protein